MTGSNAHTKASPSPSPVEDIYTVTHHPIATCYRHTSAHPTLMPRAYHEASLSQLHNASLTLHTRTQQCITIFSLSSFNQQLPLGAPSPTSSPLKKGVSPPQQRDCTPASHAPQNTPWCQQLRPHKTTPLLPSGMHCAGMPTSTWLAISSAPHLVHHCPSLSLLLRSDPILALPCRNIIRGCIRDVMWTPPPSA